jgi:hypothetical protein
VHVLFSATSGCEHAATRMSNIADGSFYWELETIGARLSNSFENEAGDVFCCRMVYLSGVFKMLDIRANHNSFYENRDDS